jgi:hypothetical protein
VVRGHGSGELSEKFHGYKWGNMPLFVHLLRTGVEEAKEELGHNQYSQFIRHYPPSTGRPTRAVTHAMISYKNVKYLNVFPAIHQ